MFGIVENIRAGEADDEVDESNYGDADFDAGVAKSQYDHGLLGRLIEDAIERGMPIELTPNVSDVPNAPAADYCEFGSIDDGLLIFSARAAAALRDLLEPNCQAVPVSCPGHALAAYRLHAVEDVLDAARSDGWWHDLKTRRHAIDITSYAFFTERLGRAAIFTVPQHWQVLVLQPFVDVVRGCGLSGFQFRKVWPRSTTARWE